MIRFGSVCSGIEAASVAWHPLGWRAAWLAEVEAFPSSVLAHRWPDVPNLGDMTALPDAVANDNIAAPDVLVGGTPCQAFSVAGMRQSLDDARGQLTLSFVRLADEIDRRRAATGLAGAVIVWENVPGVLSTKDNAFGCFLAGLAGEDQPLFPPGRKWSNAGAVYGPARAVAWRILDAQYFGVAQRRRRVFVVASSRGGFDPATVLFEFDGVRRDSAPRRETGQGAAADAGRSAAGSHWDNLTNPHPSLNQSHNTGGIGASNQEVFSQRGAGLTWPAHVASTLNAAFGSKQGLEDQHINSGAPLFVPAVLQPQNDNTPGVPAVDVCPTLRAGGNRTGGDRPPGTDVDTADSLIMQPQAIPILEPGARTGVSTTDPRAGIGIGADGDPMFTLQAGKQHGVAVAVGGDIAHTLKAEGFDASEDGTGRGVSTIAFDDRRGRAGDRGSRGELANTLHVAKGQSEQQCVAQPMAVRRLTPRECERLQGFPDDHTLVPHRGKPAADGPRYKALGNSMAVPVMRWIGERIDARLRELAAENDN